MSKALVYCCLLVFRRIDEYISLDLFYLVNLTNSFSVIPVGIVLKARCRQATEEIIIVGSAVSSSSSNLVFYAQSTMTVIIIRASVRLEPAHEPVWPSGKALGW